MKWKYRLELTDIWRDDSMTFEERRDAIVARIQNAPFYDETEWELPCIVSGLATADEPDWFDDCWDTFYDWADEHSVWVNTLGIPAGRA